MIPKVIVEPVIELGALALRWLVRVVKRREKPKPPVNPLSHKDVVHQQSQIRSATTRPVPPPRKR